MTTTTAPATTRYYVATCPDGTQVTRSTKSMRYEYVAIATKGSKPWGAVRWSGTMNGAGQEADRFAGLGYSVDLVPAVSVCRAEYIAAKAPAAPEAPTVSEVDAALVLLAKAPKAKAVVRAPGAPTLKVSARWTPMEAQPTHTCRSCTQDLAAAKFPTVAGPEVRGTECRSCRDARKATVAQ